MQGAKKRKHSGGGIGPYDACKKKKKKREEVGKREGGLTRQKDASVRTSWANKMTSIQLHMLARFDYGVYIDSERVIDKLRFKS